MAWQIPQQLVGNFWRGADGNVWVAGEDGTNSAGQWDDNSANYWGSQGYGLINDPNAPASSGGSSWGGSGGSSGGSTAPDYSQEIAGYGRDIQGYQDAINRLAGVYNANVSNLQGTRSQRLNDLNRDFGYAERDWGTQRGQTLEDRQLAAQGSIDNNRAQLEALQRLLGSYGAGNSSASSIAAPGLSESQGVADLTGIQRTFARNLGGLDTAFEDTREDRDRTSGDIQSAYDIGRRNYEADRYQQQASLLDQIRSASINRDALQGNNNSYDNYRNQSNDLLNRVTGLRTNAKVPEIGQVKFEAPELSQYSLTTGNGGLGRLLGPTSAPLNPLTNPYTEEEE